MSFLCCLVARAQNDATFLLYTALGGAVCSVLEVDRYTGQVLFVSDFGTESEALAMLSATHVFVERRRVYAVLGLLLSFGCAVLFVATKLRSAALPNGNKVSVVCEVDTIELPMVLCNEHLHAREQMHDVLRTTRRYPLDELHYFSTSLDLTRPLGPGFASFSPDAPPAAPAFVWNNFLREAFVQEGLEMYCPVLLQGYCGSKFVPDASLSVGIVCRKSNVAPEFEIDLLVWTAERYACFTVRRSSTPQTNNKDALSSYFEDLAEQMRRARSSQLFDPFVCVLSLNGHEDDIATAIDSTQSRTTLAGSIAYASFDWAQATKMHSGKLEGAAGESWNVLGDHVRTMAPTVSNGESVQNGSLLIVSDDGLKSVSEFLVYFSLVVVAELVRLVSNGSTGAATARDEDDDESDDGDGSWQGMGLSTAVLTANVLKAKLAQAVASFSVECSDAVTFLVAHRESLFTSEVSALLPTSLLSSLHRKVGEYIGSLSETDRKTQEANVVLLRDSWFSKRVCLSRQPLCRGSRRVLCPFVCFATATHFALQLDGASEPVSLSLLIDGKCALEQLLVGVLLWPKCGSVVFKIPQRPWDLYFNERERVSRLEDSVAEIVFASDLPCSGTVWLFGSVGVPMSAAAAQAELWKRRVMHALRPEKTLVGYIGGDTTTAYSSQVNERASEEQTMLYLQHARSTDDSSLLSLLTLEAKRVSIGLTQDERDQALFCAGLSVCAYDPRKLLGFRDPAIEELKRSAVPASFLQCASGPSCRGQDGFTLSIARNKLCFQCLKKFCAKCMQETVLLEGRLSNTSPVCFSCCGEIEQERQLLLQMQRSNKYSEAPTESSEETAFRQLLRLCASLAEFRRNHNHFPFVRGAGGAASLGPDWRLNLLFLAAADVPLDFYWPCEGMVQFDVHLPFWAVVENASLLSPPGGWLAAEGGVTVTLRDLESSEVVAIGSIAPLAQSVTLDCDSDAAHAVLRVTVSGKLRLARVVLQLRKHAVQLSGGPMTPIAAPSPRADTSASPNHSSFEVFGKKSSKSSELNSWSKKLAAGLVEEQLRTTLPSQRIQEPVKREVRGNATELWLVKHRNSVTFSGGLAVRLMRDDAPQKLKVIRVSCLRLDERGEARQVWQCGQFVVPMVPANSVVWFPLVRDVPVSCFIVECMDASCAPPQLWLTTE